MDKASEFESRHGRKTSTVPTKLIVPTDKYKYGCVS
jgi:hypothetical protein